MNSIIINKHFCGPPNSGNGGYVCGRLAHYIPGSAEVTLHLPPPLEKPLEVSAKNNQSWELSDGDKVVASGGQANVELSRLERASFEEACEAGAQAPTLFQEHPLPTCFVCGPARKPGDGLRIFVAPLALHTHKTTPVLAAAWIPDSTLISEDGFVAPEFLWSALDCPTGYASAYDAQLGAFDPAPVLLGRMSVRIANRPVAGEHCVITAWPAGREGRKRYGEAAAYGEDGSLLAVAKATWVAVSRQIQIGQN